MRTRTGASILETLVVIAIVGTLLGLFFPAVQAARQKALEMTCQNNLHQIDLAIAEYAEANKRLPGPGTPGTVGGWTIDILPFLEQQNLRYRVTPGVPISASPDFLLRQPGIFRCPVRSAYDEPAGSAMDDGHYVFSPSRDRKRAFSVSDAPLDFHASWANGPEMSAHDVRQRTGPHRGGFFFASGFQGGVGFMDGAGP